MDKFEQFKLNLSKKEKDLVSDYLNKIKNFISENKIDKELFSDIEEMVFEKLSLEKELDQLKIIKILKEVWEPEVIFSDYIDEKKTKKEKTSNPILEENFFEKLIENNWIRDNEDAIFLWISKTLAKKSWVSVWWIRIILVLLCFVWWLSAWLYILAWVILPVKWENYEWKNTLSYLGTQIYDVVKDFIYNSYNTALEIIKFIFVNFFKIMKVIINFIINNIFPIIRFFIFWFLAFVFGSILLWLLTLWWAYFSKFSVGNIDFMWALPEYFIWWIVAWIVSVSILTVASFNYWLCKRILNSYILSLAWISFLIALFLSISTWFDLFQKYFVKNEFKQTTQIEISNTWSYFLDLNKLSYNDEFDFDIGRIKWIRFENSTGSFLKLEINNTVFWNEKIYTWFTQSLSNISLSNIDNNIKLSLENNKTFSKKVTFTPFIRELVIYIPKWVKLTVSQTYSYYFENAFVSSEFNKYQNYLNNSCRNAEISYSENEQKFICNPDEGSLQSAKEDFLKNYVVENFDEISILKHKNRYKQEYYWNYWTKSDWMFNNLYFENDWKTLNVEFSDMSLEVDASLGIEETASWVLVSDFKINDVNINDNFEEKYYEDISIIKEFLDYDDLEKDKYN